jgi:glycosyltransferase involved in cell wall biosynthesis
VALPSRGEVPIRTLQLGAHWFPEVAGGIDRVYYELLRYLPRHGVAMRGLVMGSPEVATASGQQVRACAPATASLLVRWQALRRELRQMLAEQQPELLVSHFAPYTFPVLDLIREYPLVVHFHGPWALEGQVEDRGGLKSKFKAALERTVYRRGALCIVLSRAFRDILCHRYGVPGEHLRIVPGGVDTERFTTGVTSQEARELLGWPQNRPIVFTVRRLVRRMGLKNLVAAMEEVCRTVPEVFLAIAGKGALFEELWAQIQSQGLQNNVRLLGYLPDDELPLAYRAANLTVVPTVALEGFGLIAAESLAAGTPVLVTPVGGLPEVVSGLSPKMVLPSSGVGALAEGIESVLTGKLPLPDEQACRDYARTRYDWSVVATHLREVYVEALK